MRKLLVVFVLLVTSLTLSGCGGPSRAQQLATTPVKLSVWRVFDEDESFKKIMNNYRAMHPNVSFTYKRLRIEEYEDELLRAFAKGEGPDIFSLHNTWIGEYESLIAPLPASTTVAFSETKGSIKKETVFTLKETPSIRPAQVRRDFVDAVAYDVIRSHRPDPRAEATEKIFGLPMAVDTLALYYNRDLLNAAGIAQPPKTWNEFHQAVVALTKVGQGDEIIQSGAAIGTSRNVERAFDLLSVLMMQNGTRMTNDRGAASFTDEAEDGTSPGELALQFYTDFANPLKEVYTWNSSQPNSFEAFINGKAAFFFGYSYHRPFINARAPKLRYDITALPQIQESTDVNLANYWVESVARATKNIDWAWDFVQFASSQEQVTNYLSATNKPTARRALISTQLDNETLGPFASQLLTARSWYKGKDAAAAEEAFLDLIDAALIATEETDLPRAMNTAQNKVNQSL